MAIATANQNLVLQLKAIISSGITDFDKLSDDQKKALFTAALAAGYKTNLELFLYLKLHPEEVGLPPLPPEELTEAVVDTQTILANVALYCTDKDALEKINAQIEIKLAKQRQTVREMVKKMVAVEIARRQAEIMALRASQSTKENLRQISQDVDRKNPTQPQISAASAQILAAALPQIEAQQNIRLSEKQREIATYDLATVIIASAATNTFDLTLPEDRDAAILIALTDIPQFHSTITDTYRQVEQAVTLTSTPQFNSSISSRVQITPDILVTRLETIEPPPAAPIITLAFPPAIQETTEALQSLSTKFVNSVSANNASDEVMADLAGSITPTQRQQLIAVAIASNLVSRSAPTRDGAAAKVVIGEINHPNDKALDKTALELYAMGFALANAKKIIEQNPSHPLAKIAHENPNVFKQLETTYQQLEGSKLGGEIRPTPLSGLAATYQTITNRLSGFLPGRVGQVFNIATHPFQSLQSYVGNFIGSRITNQLKNWVTQKVVSKIANETVKKTAEFILKRGLQEGVKLLAKEGAKRGLQAIAVALGVPTGGIGLVVAAAIELGSFLLEKTLGLVKNVINGLSRALTGEDFDLRAAATAPLALLAGAGGILGSLGAATSVAVASAGVILIASTVVGFFLYITVITVAPIITTIAQLESGVGPQQGPAFGAFPRQPPYTGPILPGCSQIWPVSGGFVIQGPHGSYSHQAVEAVDIYANIGTPVKSVSSGTVTFTGWGDAYGNMITVRSTSADNRNYSVIYAHLAEIGVAVGDPVGVGTVIALSGASSSVPGFANPHLHLEYRGIPYNACPAGGVPVPDGCYSAIIGQPNACLINSKPIYTD